MLILLPPSEGKAAPSRGRPLDLDTLGFPELRAARQEALDALLAFCRDGSGAALTDEAARVRVAATLGLGKTQLDAVDADARLDAAPTARADHVYTGVLYEALDLPSLEGAAKRRATSSVAITSGLFGLLRPGDRIPAYRLSGDVTLPGLGPVAAHWRSALEDAALAALGNGLLLDLRSTAYAAFWRPPADVADRVASVRVLHESGGKRKVVSHFNKATKGRIIRTLLEAGDRPRTPAALAETLSDHGWTVESADPDARGTRLDVVVKEL